MLYCDMDEVVKFNKKGEAVGVTQQRLIHTQPTTMYDAKDRTKRLPKKLPLDFDTLVSYFPDTPLTMED